MEITNIEYLKRAKIASDSFNEANKEILDFILQEPKPKKTKTSKKHDKKHDKTSKTRIGSYKVRIYPDDTQKQMLNQFIGNYRFIYNYTIGYMVKLREDKKKIPEKNDLQTIILKELAAEYPWIKYSQAQANQHAFQEAYDAYWKFLKNIKETNKKRKASGKKPKIAPRFKRAHEGRQTCCLTNQSFKILGKKKLKLSIPRALRELYKSEGIKYRKKMKFFYKNLPDFISVRESRIIREYGKYYINLVLEVDITKKSSGKRHGTIGIDWGINNLATTYNGKEVEYIKSFLKGKDDMNKSSEYNKNLNRISKLQEIIQHKVKKNRKAKLSDPYHTGNIYDLRKKIFHLYQRNHNIKLDYINKLCYELVKAKPAHIVIEDLSFKDQLMKNKNSDAKDKRLRKLMLSTSPHLFRMKLQSKCDEYGIELIIADRSFESTKLCSNCGELVDIKLSERTFKCPNCGLVLDRDENAAINLYNYKKKKLFK